MKVGDEVEYKGQRGRATCVTSGLIDVTFDNMSPIAYECLAEQARMVSRHYNSTRDVFTIDLDNPVMQEFKLVGNANHVDNKCCCGGDSIGATRHPEYCPKYQS